MVCAFPGAAVQQARYYLKTLAKQGYLRKPMNNKTPELQPVYWLFSRRLGLLASVSGIAVGAVLRSREQGQGRGIIKAINSLTEIVVIAGQ